jgi:hypothetical protein
MSCDAAPPISAMVLMLAGVDPVAKEAGKDHKGATPPSHSIRALA